MVKRIFMVIIILIVFVALSQFSASAEENQRGISIEPFGGIFYINAPDVNFGGRYVANPGYLGGEHREDGEAHGPIFGLTFGKGFKSPLSFGRNNRVELSGFYSRAKSTSSSTILADSFLAGFTQIDASNTYVGTISSSVSIDSKAEYYGFSLVLKGDNKVGLNWKVSPYIGPTLFFFEQDIDISSQLSGGKFDGDTTSVSEDTETLYLGITGGADFTRQISDRISLVANAELSVVHARSDFDGSQETYLVSTLYTAHVTDSDEEVAVRGIGNIKLQFDIGFGTLSLSAGLHWLSYVPGVVNPRNYINSSIPDRPAHIEDESSLMVIGMAQVAIPF